MVTWRERAGIDKVLGSGEKDKLKLYDAVTFFLSAEEEAEYSSKCV